MAIIPKFLNTSASMVNVSINLKGVGSGLSHELYSTNDEIVGEVVITSTADVHINDLDISFIGSTQTRFDNFGAAPIAPGVTCTEKRFLHLHQPFEKSPSGMILKAAHPYSFAFTFVVPDRLLPSSCPCPNTDDHLIPPPTMGGNQRWETHDGHTLDDPTPDMAQVSYTIDAKLAYGKLRSNNVGRSPSGLTAHSSRRVCVVPELPESPPIFLQPASSSSSSSSSSEYRLRQEKAIGKGLVFRGGRSAGCLVMETQQPGALRGGLRAQWAPASTTLLLLRFDPPASPDDRGPPPPPPLEDVRRTLQATTVFRAGMVEEDPACGRLVGAGGGGGAAGMQQQQRSYSEAVALPSLRVSGARWQRCEPAWAHERLLEGERLEAVVAPSSRYAGGVYYLLKLQIPVEYPPGKALVPTFHSCLVSRTYRLDVTVTLSAFSSVSVRVPIQLCT